MPQPRKRVTAAQLEAAEQRRVLGEPTPRRGALGNDKRRNQASRMATSLPGESPGDPHLPVKPGQQVLDVDDDGLELDHEQCAARLVPCQEIDAARSPKWLKVTSASTDQPRRWSIATHALWMRA
jgi:hypothetical protein